ncbi:hypothetical protein [Solimicrobium silvestre]|uniref:Uncharacterized protein n=1 Tax=Solimicrobium silvestre TaxID=2099400 RepID=A0A2S9H0E1_9BURK|nr:hypothetical protein [Solimicrobium silvestre]PRC93423.1 hypothetical protein S2091_1810 [Solimicrobium silvestre]
MSYLDTPRLNFSGFFQADVSTVNNDVRYFDVDAFQESYQKIAPIPYSDTPPNGAWNPDGTGTFRLVDCKITGGRLGNRQFISPTDDPAIGMALGNADQRVSGKLVDLDPQQQMVSTIWGMQVRLSDAAQRALFEGEYEPAAFTNLWQRQQVATAPHDQQLAAIYQSVLSNVVWHGNSDSRLLESLRKATEQGYLSINMNVYGFGRDQNINRYTYGHVVGSIGPYHQQEPKRFVVGRQMIAAAPPTDPMVPSNGVSCFTCVVNAEQKTVSADFGNCLPIEGASGTFEDIGKVFLAIAKQPNDAKTGAPEIFTTLDGNSIALLGEVPYQGGQSWYEQHAGIVDMDYSKLDSWVADNINSHPLILVSPTAAQTVPPIYKVLVQESLAGLYLRADQFVYRLNPGETADVAMYSSCYGQPLATTIVTSVNTGFMGGTGGGDAPLDPPVETPVINTGSLNYPAQLNTDEHGRTILTLTAPAEGPGNPRVYIDGQLYGIGYAIKNQPDNTISNIWNLISVLAFDKIVMPEHPAWYPDIEPIFKQYANLYPIMSRHLIYLGEYESVVQNVRILDMAFALPMNNPNHMPVTRDLSEGKRNMILHWLRHPGPDGKPLKGVQAVKVATTPSSGKPIAQPVPLHLEALQTAGKTAVVLAHIANQSNKGSQP